MASLTIRTGPSAGKSITLSAGGSVVGRNSGHQCDIGLGGRSVSSRHARLYFDGGQNLWFVRDLGSVNGTQVDGRAVDLAPLEEGASVHFADVETSFSLQDGVSVPASPHGHLDGIGASTTPLDGDLPIYTEAAGSGGRIDIETEQQLRSNASFLASISQGSDIYIEKLQGAVRELAGAVAMKDPAQGYLVVARIIESGQMQQWLDDLKGVREAEDNVLNNLRQLLGSD